MVDPRECGLEYQNLGVYKTSKVNKSICSLEDREIFPVSCLKPLFFSCLRFILSYPFEDKIIKFTSNQENNSKSYK